MLNFIVKWLMRERWLVVIATVIISLWGLRVLTQMPLDVLPAFALHKWKLKLVAPGLTPEEVESS